MSLVCLCVRAVGVSGGFAGGERGIKAFVRDGDVRVRKAGTPGGQPMSPLGTAFVVLAAGIVGAVVLAQVSPSVSDLCAPACPFPDGAWDFEWAGPEDKSVRVEPPTLAAECPSPGLLTCPPVPVCTLRRAFPALTSWRSTCSLDSFHCWWSAGASLPSA